MERDFLVSSVAKTLKTNAREFLVRELDLQILQLKSFMLQ